MSLDRDKVLQAAQKFVDKKRYDKAIAEYARLVQVDPSDARTLLKIGDLQSRMGAFADAVSTYDRVGNLYATQGFALKAIAVFKQVRELIAQKVPTLEEQYGHITPRLAELYRQLGLISDAISALDEVATKHQARGQNKQAIEVFRRIVELDATNPLPHLRLAEALSRDGEVDGALQEFGIAARQLVQLGRKDDALKVLERSLHHRGDAAQARLAAELYVDKGNQQDGLRALAKLQICFQADPRDLDTLALLSRAFNLIGQAQKGVEVQKEMARIARDSGNLPKFQEVVERLQLLAPNDDVVKRLAGQLQLGLERGSLAGTGERAVEPPVPSAQARTAPPPASVEIEADDDDLIDDVEPDPSLPPPPMEAPPRPAHAAAPPMPPRPMGPVTRPDIPAVREPAPTHELIEEHHEDLEARIGQLLEDAESFRRVRLYDRAVETLRSASRLSPTNLHVNEALRDVLLEADRVDEAVDAMMRIASTHVELLDADSAAQALQDVLAYEPRNQRALEMLAELGFEVVEDEDDELPLEPPAPQAAAPLEAPRRAPPLPSFGLDEPELDDMPDSVQVDLPPPVTRPERFSTNLEVTLERVDDLLAEGLLDDARALLIDELARYPHNGLLRDRMEELSMLEQAAGSGAHERPGAAQAFDLDESLDALGLEDAGEVDNYQVDVDEIFAQFKEGVAAQIGLDDSQAHYDLGLAYKEMGLLEDAIREFDIAAADPARTCVCCSMIGIVELERGEVDRALAAFLRGLDAPMIDGIQEMVLAYDAAALFERKRQNDKALEYYRRVAALDDSYRDVAAKIAYLSSQRGGPIARTPSIMDDDEFDTALDELLTKH